MTYNELLSRWNENLPPKRKFQIAEQIVLFSENMRDLTLDEKEIQKKSKEFLLDED